MTIAVSTSAVSTGALDLRPVLLIAEAANPEWVSVPLIGWSLARALARQTPVHLVTQVRNRAAILRAGLIEGRDFTAVDSEAFARPLHKLSGLLRGGRGVGWTTVSAISTLSYYYFEHLVWRMFGDAIRRGDFRLVHRITPLSPTTPSTLARRCRKAGVPFVLGPLNGGVAWPSEFAAARRKEREWLSYLRGAYKLLPAHRSTLSESAAILVGSQSTLSEIPHRYRDKTIYVPENAIDPDRFAERGSIAPPGTLRGCFIGRLVPYKGPDMLLEAVMPLIQAGQLTLDIIGDGPLMPQLQRMVDAGNVQSGVRFHGWVKHEEMQIAISQCHLLLFPSIREFGGGVVLEAMALGIVPVVVDYAGPAELVTDDVGFKIRLGARQQIVEELRRTVEDICERPGVIERKAQAAVQRARTLFTWEAKARQIAQIYAWLQIRDGQKPDFFAREHHSDGELRTELSNHYQEVS